MVRLLVNGIYDAQTLKTLLDQGVQDISFDLRGRSPNLIPFNQLNDILKRASFSQCSLIFENDKEATILSFLNLLKDSPVKLGLQFRDHHPASFYHKFDRPFSWMFHPEGDWENILHLPQLTTVLLPLKYQSFYQDTPKLWDIIQHQNREVHLHAESISEVELMMGQEGISLSFDLGAELQKGFRSVDQEKLKKLKIWRLINEDLAS